jgi:lambda family phage portal protein
MESVSVKERILACLSIFITKLTPGGANFGRSANATSEHPDYSGKTISPGMMLELAPGENVQAVAPSGQTTDADAYIKLQEKMVAAGQGMSYEAVSRDMSQTNYSSARQAIIEDERTYGREQALLMTVLDEIYESFIISMWLAGEFDAPDFWENKDKYFAHTWIMPAKRWIDPTKEANANKIALASGQKTYQQLAAESGRNWKDMIDEMSEAGKYADKKGINLGGVIFDGKEKPEEQKTDPAAAAE